MRRSNEPRIYGPYKHRDRWRVHIVTSSGGRRKTRYQAFETRALADAFLAGARDEAQGVTVRQAVQAYLDDLRLNERAPGTISSAEDRLERLLGLPGNDQRSIRWLNGRGAELYATCRVGVASDTHINSLHVGKTWGAFCVARRWLRVSPFANVTKVGRKAIGADKERLTVDESRKLEAYCYAHAGDAGAVLTVGYLLLGARASELVQRDVRDLDDGGYLLQIGRTKTPTGRRRLLIPGVLRELLLAIAANRPPDAPLFASLETGTRWSRFVARNNVRRVCAAAQVPVLSPQALRRTQSTLATDAGVAALAVADHLGHASTAITQRAYVHPDATRDARTERAFRVIAGGKR